ncbi:MAG: S26 family signal peptidase [Candidatus Aphodosoma sp.]
MKKISFKKPISSWIKLTTWTLIFVLFIIWVGNYWWLLLYPFIFDIFITKIIPWTFWKKYKERNKTLYTIFSWIDAIVFALIAVYFINLYLFQNYQIPTSSLEQTLKVGDFLFVSKCSYGPRIPNTPLSFPLVQNTFPWGTKSYIEHPQWGYKRLKGFDTIESGDIVVFNFPAGDTVPLKCNNPDYYTLCYLHSGYQWIQDSVIPYRVFNAMMYKGREKVLSMESTYGKVISRPIDRRENYVKRCVGLPGETIELRNSELYVDGKEFNNAPGVQHNYLIQTNGNSLDPDKLHKMGVSIGEASMIDPVEASLYLKEIGMTPQNDGKWGQIYTMALTEEVLTKLKSTNIVKQVVKEKIIEGYSSPIYPLAYSKKWTRDNYGPLWIPSAGSTIELTEDNIIRYERCIVNYEGNTLEYKNGKAIINGEECNSYTFKYNYYWMMGDNRHNSADSRMWGFVPETHIVGRPVFVWLSLDRDAEWFNGKIRWNRLFKNAER